MKRRWLTIAIMMHFPGLLSGCIPLYQGQQMMHAGDYAGAIHHYESHLQRHSNARIQGALDEARQAESRRLTALALDLNAAGQYNDAFKSLSTALIYDNDNLTALKALDQARDGLFIAAKASLSRGDYAGALADYMLILTEYRRSDIAKAGQIEARDHLAASTFEDAQRQAKNRPTTALAHYLIAASHGHPAAMEKATTLAKRLKARAHFNLDIKWQMHPDHLPVDKPLWEAAIHKHLEAQGWIFSPRPKPTPPPLRITLEWGPITETALKADTQLVAQKADAIPQRGAHNRAEYRQWEGAKSQRLAAEKVHLARQKAVKDNPGNPRAITQEIEAKTALKSAQIEEANAYQTLLALEDAPPPPKSAPTPPAKSGQRLEFNLKITCAPPQEGAPPHLHNASPRVEIWTGLRTLESQAGAQGQSIHPPQKEAEALEATLLQYAERERDAALKACTKSWHHHLWSRVDAHQQNQWVAQFSESLMDAHLVTGQQEARLIEHFIKDLGVPEAIFMPFWQAHFGDIS